MLSVCALVGFGVAALAAAASDQQGGQPPPQYSADLKVGDPAPDFSLPGSDGRTHSLSELKGRTVVLAWFPKAFTGG